RLRRAECYRELGDESRFTQLLTSLPNDYPDGDMVLDGVFELSVRFMERGDWATVSNVLTRVQALAERSDPVRDHEFAGRERYYLARAWVETGEQERGYAEYERLVRERPLSFYMQLAYARLYQVSEERAVLAKRKAIENAQSQRFSFSDPTALDRPEFRRGLELLRVGELELAQAELSLSTTDGPLLWAEALQYAHAGATALAHKTVRAKLTDWLGRWPVGEWAEAWQVAFPRPYHSIVQKAIAKHSLPEELVYAIMREESGFDARVVSHADAYGLMQLIMPTAKHFAK